MRLTRFLPLIVVAAIACDSPLAPVRESDVFSRVDGYSDAVDPRLGGVVIADSMFFGDDGRGIQRVTLRSATDADSTWQRTAEFSYRLEWDRVGVSKRCFDGWACSAILIWHWYDRTAEGFAETGSDIGRYRRVTNRPRAWSIVQNPR